MEKVISPGDIGGVRWKIERKVETSSQGLPAQVLINYSSDDRMIMSPFRVVKFKSILPPFTIPT